jgi:mannose-6-phosphate isomerase-like protein (cupin superfamily)
MAAWATQDVRLFYDYVSPSEATEIRLLPNLPRGEIVHATTGARRVSAPAVLDGIVEMFFVLAGSAELWRAAAGTEEVTLLCPGRCVKMPPGTLFQYRTGLEPLEFLVITGPRWERERWSHAPRGRWSFDEVGAGVPAGGSQQSSWTADLRDEPDYLAPDGSEIRLLLEDEPGGFAHCTLAPGACTQAVTHRTVDEIWFVLGGTGSIWRQGNGDSAEDLLRPGRCVTIPVGTSFQFRADGSSPLRIGIGTFPKWPGASEAEPVDGPWPVASPAK